MTTKIGGIVVDVDARLTKLEKSLNKADRQFKKFERNSTRSGKRIEGAVGGINKSFSTLKGGLATLGIGLGINALVDMGRFALNAADDLATAADRANIGVERFQSLKEVFRELEVDAAGFDKAMGRLQGTLGDVQRGVEDEATKALDAMGVSARVLSGEITTTDQLLDAIAGASKDFGTEAEFTSAAVDIFGQRLGNQLAPALAEGTDAIHEMEQAARDNGMVIEEEMINKLADANEVVEKFSVQTQNSFIIWSAGVIDSIQRAGAAWDAFQAGLTADGTGSGKSYNQSAFAPGVQGALAAYSQLASSIPKPNAISIKRGGGAKRARGGGGSARRSSGSVRISDEQKLLDLFKEQSLENERILQLQEERHSGAELAASIQEEYWAIEKRFPKLEKGRLELLKLQTRQITLQKDRFSEIDQILEDWNDTESLFLGDDEVQQQLGALMKASGIGAEGIEAANVRIAKSFKDSADESIASIQRLADAVQGGGFLDILGAVVGFGLQLGSVGVFGDKVANNINRPRGFASGTGYAPGGMAMVGEYGPELVNLPRGSQVIPNHRMANQQPVQILVTPSKYFNATVDGRAANVAAPMAAQAVPAAAELTHQQSARAASRRLA